MKRLLDCSASDFRKMTGKQLKQSIQASEGRVIVAEVIGAFAPLYPAVTNAELAAAFGADLLLLNMFDVFQPVVNGLDTNEPNQMVERLKQLTGRPIGVNLEPIDPNAKQLENFASLPKGRMATEESLQEAKRLGFDFICLTGNPKTGVTNNEIVKAIETARSVLGEDGLIIAGKMHAAGVANETGEGIVSEEVVVRFIRAGADVVLMPAPGTVPGVTLDKTEQLVRVAHEHGALVMLTIGTSQEGADENTIRQIALASKMAGADLYHIGDAGYHGIAIPENIMTYSIAIRGKRHTYIRMARSPLR
ncbi:haloacid dehalogenase-like hydrolase [Geobacillus sp. NFOSA3]|uniref:PEP phosphonomutase n=1 Tax=Parageobacillus galactosidasius TaxID=883812 RepID=A0A226QI38_9BACL|nr:PEP phosphonomutase [Parageobacillus galactosidasius]NNU92417.1 haloacid dehalogenase-like hydrolase [Geobacillus sp. NFOSA3]OXB92263.1 PEP phosphonomutase [Parageobacillus galactosidasius]